MGCCCGKLEERINELFEPNKIIAKEIFWPNLEYQRSLGCCQTKGSGALVLTSDVLWFNLLCPDTQIVIPLRSILAVKIGRIPHQHGGLGPGLIVDYADPASGMEDQVIFSLNRPQNWKMLIEAGKGNYFGELERRVSQRFVECRIIAKEIFWANLQFQRSLGSHSQVQGNGALVLTPYMLWFTLLIPEKQIEIPLQNITAVEVHTQPRRSPMVVITFVDATATNEDQVMFASKDPQYWKRMIDETIQGGQNRL